MNIFLSLGELLNIPVSEFTRVGFYTALILLLAGIVLLFAGKLLIKVVVGVGFGVLLAYLALLLLTYLKTGTVIQILGIVIAFIIGFITGWAVFKLSLSIVAGLWVAITVAKYLSLSLLSMFLLAIILIVAFYLIIEPLTSIIAALAGLALIYFSVNALAGPQIAIAVTLVLLILAIAARMRRRRK
ncbi:hypothetical protein ACSU1N_01220 [Thermogladius sp. 4427co]|uniref:hypothetical protein n=1 Tax=Thermogladius sp. 4427co TaxID=3450718 RepID=UPI003F7A7E73